MDTTQAVLLSILTGGALVPICGTVIALIDEMTSNPLSKGVKRMLAFALSFGLGVGSYALAVYGGFWEFPAEPAQRVADFVLVTSLVFASSQALLTALRSDTVQKSIGNNNLYSTMVGAASSKVVIYPVSKDKKDPYKKLSVAAGDVSMHSKGENNG